MIKELLKDIFAGDDASKILAAEKILIIMCGSREAATIAFLRINPIISRFSDADTVSLQSFLEQLEFPVTLPDHIRLSDNLRKSPPKLSYNVLRVLTIIHEILEERKTDNPAEKEARLLSLLPDIHTKKRYTIKSIRDDFGVSQRTFAKWLYIIFEEKYHSVRWLTLDEYLEIYAALMLYKGGTKFNFARDGKKYMERLEKLTFTKSDIATNCYSKLKTMKADLSKKYPWYDGIDKFPWAMMMEMEEQMEGRGN